MKMWQNGELWGGDFFENFKVDYKKLQKFEKY